MKSLICLNWNIEWSSPTSKRGLLIRSLTEAEDPDIICYSEGFEANFPSFGHTISSNSNYGYRDTKNKRKVLLWSKHEWSNIDKIGSDKLPPGRFVTGVTAGIRIVGVCIPWKDAHVRTGNKNRKTWEDHRTFLVQLNDLIQTYLKENQKVIVLGDFNQTIPRKRQPENIYKELKEVIDPKLKIITADLLDNEGKYLIDHVCLSKTLDGQVTKIIPKRSEDDVRLSDHVGVVVSINVGLS